MPDRNRPPPQYAKCAGEHCGKRIQINDGKSYKVVRSGQRAWLCVECGELPQRRELRTYCQNLRKEPDE